jgi:hypothetical protein
VQELKAGGVSFVRTGRANWNAQQIDAQIAAEKELEDAAAAQGLLSWLWLGDLPNLPTTAGSPKEQLLTQVVNAFEAHPGLGARESTSRNTPASPPRGSSARTRSCARSTPTTRS